MNIDKDYKEMLKELKKGDAIKLAEINREYRAGMQMLSLVGITILLFAIILILNLIKGGVR